jgi:hypothetical protein
VESLALAAAVIMLTVYGSGFIALGLSFIRNKIWQIVTYVFGGFAIITGLWLGYVLIDGNGLFIAVIPLIFGAVAIWNTTRRNRGPSLPPAPSKQNFS